jgi:hypothetical protein
MTSFVGASAVDKLVRGRPTSIDQHIWSPDGRTVYYFGGGNPYFTNVGKGMCTNWLPEIYPWNHPGKIVQIVAGNSLALFLTEDNRVFGTGSQNQFGQLGPNNTHPEMKIGETIVEIPLPTTDRIVQIEAGVGASVSMVLTEAGDVYSCGELNGRRNTPATPNNEMHMIPRERFNNIPVRQVSAGGCAIAFRTDDGAVYVCGCGSNSEAKGIIANLDAIHGHYVAEPVKVTALWDAGVRATMISCGRMYTIVVGTSIHTNSTVVYGWGGNWGGQLGEDFRQFPNLLEPTLLGNVMAKLSIGVEGLQKEIVHVAAGWYHTLITLNSGEVLSLSVGGRYGQIGRPTPTAFPIPPELEVSCCDFMILDRPVRAAFPGTHYSLLIPIESTALSSHLSTDLNSFVIGTCGLGGNGQLAYWGDDIIEWNQYQCRMTVRFFSLAEAIESAKYVPAIVPEPEVSRRKPVTKNRRNERYDDSGDDEDVGDLEEDEDFEDEEDEGLLFVRVSFSDLRFGLMTKPETSLQSLPVRLIASLREAWDIAPSGDALSAKSLLQEIEIKRVEAEENSATQKRGKHGKRKSDTSSTSTPKPFHRYGLVIADHYNVVDVEDLVNIFSPSFTPADAEMIPLLHHFRERLEGLSFVSCSLYARDRSVVHELGLTLRDPARFPCFTSLEFDQTSLLDQVAFEATQDKGDMVPHLEDGVFADLMTALLHQQPPFESTSTSSAGNTLPPSPITSLTFFTMGIGRQTLHAIVQAVSSYPHPETQVHLKALYCTGVGFGLPSASSEPPKLTEHEEYDFAANLSRHDFGDLVHGGYAAIRDLLMLNLPSLKRVQLLDQCSTMCSEVAALLAPALRVNTHLEQLWLSVTELGAEGVGIPGVKHLYRALQEHTQPKECVLYDIDISGDDGQPEIDAAKKLSKQWQALLKRNGNNYLQRLNAQRASPEGAGTKTAGGNHKRAKRSNAGRSLRLTHVTRAEKRLVEYITSRPWDAPAEQWRDDYEYVKDSFGCEDDDDDDGDY